MSRTWRLLLWPLLVVAAWLTPAAAALVRGRRFPGMAVRADEPESSCRRVGLP